MTRRISDRKRNENIGSRVYGESREFLEPATEPLHSKQDASYFAWRFNVCAYASDGSHYCGSMQAYTAERPTGATGPPTILASVFRQQTMDRLAQTTGSFRPHNQTLYERYLTIWYYL